jgi:serine/threonine protein kinase
MSQCILTFEYLVREKHLYHRDIKPQNLLYEKKEDKYTVYISDFGVSKALHLEKLARLFSMLNTVVGTRDYLAPKLYEAYASKNLKNI